MHGERIGFGKTPLVALGYLGVAALLFGCAKFAIVNQESAGVTSLGHSEDTSQGVVDPLGGAATAGNL